MLGIGTNPLFSLGPSGLTSGPQTVPVEVICSTNCSASGVPKQVTWTTAASTLSGGNWLSAVSSFNSTGPGGSVTISVNPGALAAGLYTGVVTVTSDQAAPLQIPVALNVWNGPVPAVFAEPATISLTAVPFAAPLAEAADICTYTGSLVVQQSARATTSNGGNCLGATVVPDVTARAASTSPSTRRI